MKNFCNTGKHIECTEGVTPPAPEVWDYEGILTIGNFTGEGNTEEYGFRSGFGNDYGSIPDFYTYYAEAGIYWIDGTLYVWGVNVESISIDGVEYSNGIYNEFGYTSFAIPDNPFTGETAAIKVKGTATETWDYEGVMTVGKDADDLYFGFDTGFLFEGGLLPNYKFTYNNIKYLFYNTDESQGFISVECNKLKIGNYLLNKIGNLDEWPGIQISSGLGNWKIHLDGEEQINPFQAVGQTCTIKIKL
jgi:hypothetical protein